MDTVVSVRLDEASLAPFAEALDRSGTQAVGHARRSIRERSAERWHELDLDAQPRFVRARLGMLPRLLELFAYDGDWRLPEAAYRDLLGALAYFGEADDLIPDHSHLGLLDDALVLQLAFGRHRAEWRSWLDFRDFVELNPDCGADGCSRERWLENADEAVRSVLARPRPASFLDGAPSGRFRRESHRYAERAQLDAFAIH